MKLGSKAKTKLNAQVEASAAKNGMTPEKVNDAKAVSQAIDVVAGVTYEARAKLTKKVENTVEVDSKKTNTNTPRVGG